jgi:hypothetical protein
VRTPTVLYKSARSRRACPDASLALPTHPSASTMAPLSISTPSSPPTELSDLAPGAFEGGLSDPESAEFRKRRHLFDVVNVLRSSGCVSYSSTRTLKLHLICFSVDLHLDLPQIAVVGSQSVGKSSLIEAISGVRRPFAMNNPYSPSGRLPFPARAERARGVRSNASCHPLVTSGRAKSLCVSLSMSMAVLCSRRGM